uniref:Uncharacterized protein n=1 Tax=viral metagenome TaxID=1070528 RepID=A0A6M3LVX9_9ZZZZ
MSRTTTYKCDRCGDEDTDNKNIDLKFVAIGIKDDTYSVYLERTFNLQDAQRRGMEMCLECRRKLGIETLLVQKTDPPPVYPTLEDTIREIVREEISSQ